MAYKQYKVVREAHEHDRFFTSHPEYKGYRMYLVEVPGGNMYQYRSLNYLVTREGFLPGQNLNVDEGTEILPVGDNSSVHLGGNKVVVYRPERYLEQDFKIVSAVLDGEPVERFGGRDMDRRFYTLFNAERPAHNGYKGVLVRIFAGSTYAPGMSIPANEAVGLPIRNSREAPHYYHDTTSKAYTDRVWRAVRNSCGISNSP